MKVVQILYSGLGGHGSVALSLAAAANRRWHSELVFFGIEPLLPEYERLCRERDIAFQYVPVRQGQAWNSWSALYKRLIASAPDAIILHSVKAILPCWLYASRRNVRLVAVEHQPNNLKKRSEWIVSRLLMRLADAVVVLTSEYRALLQAGIGGSFRAKKVHVIPNGIDTSAFMRIAQHSRREKGRLRIGMAARFTDTKRQAILVDAIACLVKHDAADTWSLSLAGAGECLSAVKAHAESAGLSEVVEFPGYLGEQELHDWFCGLDFYAHASTGETLSTSLLQAMAMELPIVGSDVPGISDLLVKGGGCGLVAEAQTGEAFAAAFEKLARDRELAGKLARNARKLAEDQYSQEAMFAAYHKLILAP